MSETKRKNFTGEFKAKIAFEAIRGLKTVNVVARSLGYIRRRLACGRRSCKNRHPACLMPGAARNQPTHLPARNVSIPRLAG